MPKNVDEHHRQIADGWFRAAIFGVSDGLVTNTSFILGFAGAAPGHHIVRVAGLAALIAGGFSMGCGELLSMRAQKELLEYEIEIERQAIASDPIGERNELSALFKSRGIDAELAERLATDLMVDPELALRTHAREELGIDPSATGNPWLAAISSLLLFAVGALVPLLPWYFDAAANPVWVSVVLAGLASAAIGGAIGWFTRRGIVRWSIIQLLITGISAGVTFGVGRLFGH